MEIDTLEHAWECLAQIIQGGHTDEIVCDVGMPVLHHGVRYNCRVYLVQGKVLGIRPKMSLADDGNYRYAPAKRDFGCQVGACWQHPGTQ